MTLFKRSLRYGDLGINPEYGISGDYPQDMGCGKLTPKYRISGIYKENNLCSIFW
jgi:hypothetical protein